MGKTNFGSGLILPGHVNTNLPKQVDVYIHPISKVTHPTYSASFRWAVMIGGAPPQSLNQCVNAGGCDTYNEASVMGEAVGAAVALALRAYGLDVKYRMIDIPFDPMPAQADDRPLAKFE
jgi:hypothetical protein